MMLAMLVRHFGEFFLLRSSCGVGDSQRVAAAAWLEEWNACSFSAQRCHRDVEGAFV